MKLAEVIKEVEQRNEVIKEKVDEIERLQGQLDIQKVDHDNAIVQIQTNLQGEIDLAKQEAETKKAELENLHNEEIPKLTADLEKLRKDLKKAKEEKSTPPAPPSIPSYSNSSFNTLFKEATGEYTSIGSGTYLGLELNTTAHMRLLVKLSKRIPALKSLNIRTIPTDSEEARD